MSRCLHFKLTVLGVLRDHTLRVTQLGHSREYYWITRPFTHAFLGNSSDPGVLRDKSCVAIVNGVLDSLTSPRQFSKPSQFITPQKLLLTHVAKFSDKAYKHLVGSTSHGSNLACSSLMNY